jgi:hypothetical protein
VSAFSGVHELLFSNNCGISFHAFAKEKIINIFFEELLVSITSF